MEELQTIKYKTNDIELNIRIDYEEETVWLTTDQLAILFNKTKQNISRHLNNIFMDNEYSVVKFYLTTATDGKTYNIKHYNLEIVLLIGNKIDQKKTSEFREYILDILKEYKKTHKRYEIVKFIDKTLEIDVNIDPTEETVWLTLDDISRLFDRDRSVIGKHIKKIYQDNELEENRTRAKNARHLPDGRQYCVDFYNLDIILSVGYRVNSKRGTMFGKWASKLLKCL